MEELLKMKILRQWSNTGISAERVGLVSGKLTDIG